MSPSEVEVDLETAINWASVASTPLFMTQSSKTFIPTRTFSSLARSGSTEFRLQTEIEKESHRIDVPSACLATDPAAMTTKLFLLLALFFVGAFASNFESEQSSDSFSDVEDQEPEVDEESTEEDANADSEGDSDDVVPSYDAFASELKIKRKALREKLDNGMKEVERLRLKHANTIEQHRIKLESELAQRRINNNRAATMAANKYYQKESKNQMRAAEIPTPYGEQTRPSMYTYHPYPYAYGGYPPATMVTREVKSEWTPSKRQCFHMMQRLTRMKQYLRGKQSKSVWKTLFKNYVFHCQKSQEQQSHMPMPMPMRMPMPMPMPMTAAPPMPHVVPPWLLPEHHPMVKKEKRHCEKVLDRLISLKKQFPDSWKKSYGARFLRVHQRCFPEKHASIIQKKIAATKQHLKDVRRKLNQIRESIVKHQDYDPELEGHQHKAKNVGHYLREILGHLQGTRGNVFSKSRCEHILDRLVRVRSELVLNNARWNKYLRFWKSKCGQFKEEIKTAALAKK